MARHAVVVLGMHRSGTSALAQLLGRMGLALPRTPILAGKDNPDGYFESRLLTEFNQRLLESAGTHWRDYAPVGSEWLADSARDADVDAAISLIRKEFGDAPAFVMKDPRLCRLMPLWRRAFDALGIRWSAVIAVRRPLEVARSLAARAREPSVAHASVTDVAKCSLMWLRYLLDAERHTREVSRCCVDHGDLLGFPARVVAQLRDGLGGSLMSVTARQAQAASDSIRPELHRQRGGRGPAAASDAAGRVDRSSASDALLGGVLETMRRLGGEGGGGLPAKSLDEIRSCLDSACARYDAMRSPADRTGPEDRAAELVLRATAESCVARAIVSAPPAPSP